MRQKHITACEYSIRPFVWHMHMNMHKLKKLILITATTRIVVLQCSTVFCFSDSLGMIIPPKHVRQKFDMFPEEAQYLWTQGFLKHSRHIFFHWMLLHNTNQAQQHSCGRGYVQHIQLQQAWASKAQCLSSAKPADDTSWVCRYPVADSSLPPWREHTSV